MKKINRCISVLLFLLVIISLMPFTKVNVEAAAKPLLEKKSISMVIGETSTIKVKNAKGSRISYKTNKKSIAAVSQKGKVTGKKNGKAKITVLVKKGSKTTKLTYKVTVKKPKLSKSKLAVKKGSTVKLSIKNKPKKAKYTWSSSNKTVATVNKNGKITAKSQGTATIKVKVKT